MNYTKIVDGVVVELTQDEINDYEQRCAFCVEDSIEKIKNLVNERRVDFESAGVVYTVDATPKTYQTGGIPHNTNRNYEQNYFDLASVGLGGVIKATDNTSDTFTPAQVVELCGRVVALAYAIQSSCDTLDAAADLIVTYEDFDAMKSRVAGSADWPTAPFPE